MTGTLQVENLLYGGRTLVGHTDVDGLPVVGWPGVAQEAIRAINHLTGDAPIPAPTLYRILGELKGLGHLLPQTCVQLARGLEASLNTKTPR